MCVRVRACVRACVCERESIPMLNWEVVCRSADVMQFPCRIGIYKTIASLVAASWMGVNWRVWILLNGGMPQNRYHVSGYLI